MFQSLTFGLVLSDNLILDFITLMNTEVLFGNIEYATNLERLSLDALFRLKACILHRNLHDRLSAILVICMIYMSDFVKILKTLYQNFTRFFFHKYKWMEIIHVDRQVFLQTLA